MASMETHQKTVGRPAPKEQCGIIADMMKKHGKMEAGQTWCLISSKWLETWIDYTGSKAFWQYRPEEDNSMSSAIVPGPIENSVLLEVKDSNEDKEEKNLPDGIVHLRMSAQEIQDFFFLPLPVWETLCGWYTGGPLIKRTTKMAGVITKRVKVDLHPVYVVLAPCKSSSENDIVKFDTAAVRPYPRDATLQKVLEDEAKRYKSASGTKAMNTEEGEQGTPKIDKMEEEDVGAADRKSAAEAASTPTKSEDKEEKNKEAAVRLWYREETRRTFPYEVGERVEACYRGEWYPGDLLHLADKDPHNRFVVLCDEDKDKKSKPTTKVKLIRREKLLPGEGEKIISWKPVNDMQLRVQLGDPNFSLVSNRVCKLMLETKKTDGTWVREIKVRDWRDFEVNDEIDCLDTENHWLAAQVLQVNNNRIYVTYIGYERDWNEWIDTNSERLAKAGTHCERKEFSRRMDYDDGDWRGGGGGYSGGGVRGSVGLRNLGNTCFMNSTLQCMNATPVLADFFVDGDYTSEINPDAYKSHGRIAREFGKLLKEMWDRRPHTVTPSRFKSAIGDYSDRFSGYQQQDSQELLAALLEGLHEDLNRVRKKPYDPNPVIGNGEDDEEKAQLSWSKHRKREDSVIIDNIYGQIRSQVICPACNRASVKFDPCGILQLPFPNVDTKVQVVTLVRANPELPRRAYAVAVPKNGSVIDLHQELAKMAAGVNAKKLVSCEIYQSKVYKIFSPRHQLESIMANDKIYAFECPDLKEGKDRDNVIIAVNHKVSGGSSYYDQDFGTPFLLTLPLERRSSGASSASYDDDDEYISAEKAQRIIREKAMMHVENTNTAATSSSSEAAAPSRFKVMFKQGYDDFKEYKNGEKIQFGRSFEAALFWEKKDYYQPAGIKKDKSLQSSGGGSGGEVVTLEGCLRGFTKEELLSAGNEYKCDHCGHEGRGKKKLDLWRLPNILIIQLKRFQYTRHYRSKIETYVEYPLEGLDMSPWTRCEAQKKDSTYDLFAVSCHGGGLGGGHYWAYAKNLIDKKWYTLNDSSVSRMSPEKVRTSDAYLLFYVKRGATQKK